jgi:hypothetical protein
MLGISEVKCKGAGPQRLPLLTRKVMMLLLVEMGCDRVWLNSVTAWDAQKDFEFGKEAVDMILGVWSSHGNELKRYGADRLRNSKWGRGRESEAIYAVTLIKERAASRDFQHHF